ncbi:DUF4253 domain-containing protein, partial [Amycolatopsis sp. H20-H5]|nr:DUF4253 domain-containing protein [Amycolatopsis sp. H20-H5]
MTVIPFRSRQRPAVPPSAGRQRGRLWVSDAALDPGTYRGLATSASAAEHWPVVITHGTRSTRHGRDWIAEHGWDPPAAGNVPDLPAGLVLAGWWERSWRAGRRMEPFGPEFPGLVRRSRRRVDPVFQAAESGSVLAMASRGR